MREMFPLIGYFYRLEQLVEPELVKEESGDTIEGVEGVDDDHEYEPEPHGQVHLLVDNVLRTDLISAR